MASLRAMKRHGLYSSTDPASLPAELFHQVLTAVHRSGDVEWRKYQNSDGPGWSNFGAALVSRRWHHASLRTLTVARVTTRFEEEADLLKELARFKALTEISLYEDAVEALSARFRKTARKNWPGLRTLVLRNTWTDFGPGPETAGPYLRSLTSVVIRGAKGYGPRDPVPRWIASMESLTSLDLIRCEISELPADFGQRFPKLRRFRLGDVHELTLPDSMGDLAGLETLVLDRCGIPALPRSFTRLSALRKLIWKTWMPRDVSAIGHLTGLRYLYMSSFTPAVAIPAGLFAGLKLLRVLKLETRGSTVSSPVLQSLIHCTGLRVLHIFGCEQLLGDLSWLPELTALRKIRCLSVPVPQLPGNIEALKRLEWASFSSILSKSLPQSICDMTSLRYLSIGSSDLEELPNSLACLTRLTELVLRGSEKFNVASMNFGTISSLRSLRIMDCHLTGIPENLGCLPNLTYLFVQCDAFESLLPRGFPSLQTLHIGGLLRDAPRLVAKSDVAQLTVEDYPCLTSLRIAYWKAESLPDALGHLQHLKHLELVCGEFTRLPETLTSLCSLKELRLDQCKRLINMPAGLGTISSLTMLRLDGCDSFDLDSLTGRLQEVYKQ